MKKGGERLDRIPVVEGEIRIGDRAYLQPDRMGELLDAGADIVVRAGWKNARWLGPEGKPIDLLAVLRKGTTRGLIDQPIWIARKAGDPLALRIVAVKKLPQAAEAARRKARREAAKGRHQISKGTLVAAEWTTGTRARPGRGFCRRRQSRRRRALSSASWCARHKFRRAPPRRRSPRPCDGR